MPRISTLALGQNKRSEWPHDDPKARQGVVKFTPTTNKVNLQPHTVQKNCSWSICHPSHVLVAISVSTVCVFFCTRHQVFAVHHELRCGVQHVPSRARSIPVLKVVQTQTFTSSFEQRFPLTAACLRTTVSSTCRVNVKMQKTNGALILVNPFYREHAVSRAFAFHCLSDPYVACFPVSLFSAPQLQGRIGAACFWTLLFTRPTISHNNARPTEYDLGRMQSFPPHLQTIKKQRRKGPRQPLAVVARMPHPRCQHPIWRWIPSGALITTPSL